MANPPDLQTDLLTSEEVFVMLDEFYEKNPNPIAENLKKVFRESYIKDGKMPSVILRDFGLEPITLYRRKS